MATPTNLTNFFKKVVAEKRLTKRDLEIRTGLPLTVINWILRGRCVNLYRIKAMMNALYLDLDDIQPYVNPRLLAAIQEYNSKAA